MSAMTSNFGGKKAAPFRKGGKPRKAIVAKAVVAKAKRAKREMALSVITGREIDLGTNGSKWRHGWIPLNPSAVALKAHKGKGAHHEAPSMEEHAKIIGRHVEAARKEAAASSTGDYTRETPTHVGPKGQGFVRVTHSPKGSKYTTSTEVGGKREHTEHNNGSVAALELHNRIYGVHKSMGSTSGDISFPSNPHNQGGLEASRARAREAAAKKTSKGDISFPKNEHNSGGLEASRVRSGGLPNQALIDNAETMYGTGSKQHLAALARFGTAKRLAQKRATSGAKATERDRQRRRNESAMEKLNAAKKAAAKKAVKKSTAPRAITKNLGALGKWS